LLVVGTGSSNGNLNIGTGTTSTSITFNVGGTTKQQTFASLSSIAFTLQNPQPTVTGASTTVALSTVTPPTNPSGTTWQYTLAASESGAGSNGWLGASVTISGYIGGATGNNGTFVITASTATTVQITNATGTTTNTGTPVMISSAVVNSPALTIAGTVNTGAAGTLNSVADTWTIQNVITSVAPNPVSTLTFAHSGSTNAVSSIKIPGGTYGSGGGLTLDDGSGYTMAVGSYFNTLEIYEFHGPNGTAPGYPVVRLMNGSAVSAAFGTSSAGLAISNIRNTSLAIVGDTTTSVSNASVVIGSNETFVAASGTQYGVCLGTDPANIVSLNFAPTSGTGSFRAVTIKPTINQTGGANGSVTSLLVNAVETSVGGTHLLLDLQAGTTGGVSKFSINNGGICTNYAGVATVSQGHPAEYATVDLINQSGAITATTLYAVPSASGGVYRISWSADITTAASSSSILGGTNGFQILATSPTDSLVKTSPRTITSGVNTDATNTTATGISGVIVAYAAASTNIQYQFDYTSVGATAMVYELHIKLERL